MYVKEIQLINFRNYKNLNIKLSKNINVFVGNNAQGKTNILESLYYCGLSKSHRTNKDRELIRWGEKEAYIKAYVAKQRLDKKIELKIFDKGKKGININSIKITKLADFIGTLNIVIFSPEDLAIVKGSPINRRRFIDIELCKLSKKYFYNLVQYKKVLNERNSAIKKINKSKLNSEILDIYDKQLVYFGSEIIQKRLKYIKNLNSIGNCIHEEITSGKENILFRYITAIKNFDDIENNLLELLLKNRKKDIDNNVTSIGPHRDDFLIEINGIDTRVFGSQGQQRTAVLTIKFASLELIKKITNDYPVLLLDDVLSELDIDRQKYVLNSIKNVQTLITCTGIVEIKKHLNDTSKLFNVENGTITEMEY